MKHLKDILEKKFKRVQPRTKEELESIIKKSISVLGNDADLNFIDTSKITDMSNLFEFSNFNGDISRWDTSRVIYMFTMFYNSKFNGDISSWDTSRVTDMRGMFAYSNFNGDISDWNVKSVKYIFNFNNNSKLEDKHCPKFNK